jgi:hypothetical protein
LLAEVVVAPVLLAVALAVTALLLLENHQAVVHQQKPLSFQRQVLLTQLLLVQAALEVRLVLITQDWLALTLYLLQSHLWEEEGVRLWIQPFLPMEAVVVVKVMEQAPVLVLLVKDLRAVAALQAQQITPAVEVAAQEVRVKHQTILR